MATAFKSLDPVPFPAKHQPRIRVAFSATPAILAVRDKAAATPAAASTLDELRAKPPLRVLLADRNAIIERVNTGPDLSEEEQGLIYDEISRLEALVSNTPARTTEDAIVKLVAAAQVAAEGHELDDAEAVRAIADAQRHLGVGYIHRELRHYAGQAADGIDPSACDWQYAYDAYLTARGARQLHERLVLDPAAARYEAVRSQWPSNHEVSADPVATAALDVVDYEQVQERFDELVGVEHAALEDLLFCPAPTAEGLTTKLRLFGSEEMWTVEKPGMLAEAFAAHACRFARPATDVGSDAALLAAFADRRAIGVDLRCVGTLGAEEEGSWHDRADQAEAPLHRQRASTIPGVVAKLRLAFSSLLSEAWSDLAIINPGDPTFRESLNMGDMVEQLLWTAIEDLARIGKVELGGQGA